MAIEQVFETHSTTVDNEQGHATGWLPGQPSEQGRAQAQQLRWRRLGDEITAVFSSDRWNEQWILVIGHGATRWGLDHLIGGVPLEDLAEQDFAWQEGWEYRVS